MIFCSNKFKKSEEFDDDSNCEIFEFNCQNFEFRDFNFFFNYYFFFAKSANFSILTAKFTSSINLFRGKHA